MTMQKNNPVTVKDFTVMVKFSFQIYETQFCKNW